jgi:lactoylglutathione lyase
MKGLAFVYDPDGYWVELVRRGENSGISNEFNFSQTMLRVKDPAKSLAFYNKLGMKLLLEKHFDNFSLFFLGSSNVKDGQDVKTMFDPVLELTHNHGTENDDDFKHFNGNEQDKPGFGHIGFLVDDVYNGMNVCLWMIIAVLLQKDCSQHTACDGIREMGYGFRKVRIGVEHFLLGLSLT